MKWRYARNSHLEQAYSSVPKVKRQTDVKRFSLNASPATKAKKIQVYGGQDEKYRRVVLDIIPCVVPTSLETDAFMAIVACFDMLMVTKKNSARSKKTRFSRIGCYSERKKTSKVVYLKTHIIWILFHGKLKSWDWTLRRGTPWKFLVCTWNKNWIRERKKAIWRHYPKKVNQWTSWAKSLRAQFWEETPGETSRQASFTSKVAWELGEKNIQAQSRRQLRFFFFLWKHQRHRRSFVCCGFGSFTTQFWARRIDPQMQWILWEGPKLHMRTCRDREQCK